MPEQDRDYRFNDGRRYHGFQEEAYYLPNDETEVSRLDLQHEVWRMSMRGSLHIAPIVLQPGSLVLDVGTGTGIWAIDFARSNPFTRVIGMDLSSIQPTTNVPANCEFKLANAEEAWTFEEPFDFIHSRLLCFGMHDWSGYFRRCFNNLKPGGWVEAQEDNFPLVCDDDSAGPDSALMRFASLTKEAMAKGGIDAGPEDRFKEYMSIQGFVNIRETVMKQPCTPWPEDEDGKKLGGLQRQNILMALEGGSMMLFTKQLGWTKGEVEALILEVREDLEDLGKHIYCRVTAHCAQKPVET